MIIFSAGLEGVNVPFESFRSRRSLRKTTPPPNVATVLSTPEGFPWRHFSPKNAQLLIVVRTFGSWDAGSGILPPIVKSAAARHTEIDALEPRPEPIGIADLRRNDTSLSASGERERYR
jgi:hypothetical protein